VENDSIRASGTDTLVDIWIDGKIRAICITHEAIGAYVGFERAAQMSEDERCAFLKNKLSTVLSAAKARLREGDSDASQILIDAGQLARADGIAPGGRKTERRKGERRTMNLPLGDKPDRRSGERRKGERRRHPPKSTA
jgi:hypothetical protein